MLPICSVFDRYLMMALDGNNLYETEKQKFEYRENRKM